MMSSYGGCGGYGHSNARGGGPKWDNAPSAKPALVLPPLACQG